jgi:ribA/ribD-fused uncharacterized protein
MRQSKEFYTALPIDRVNQPNPTDPVLFYPKEFNVFDNFTAYQVQYDGYLWSTSEHAFQAAGFKGVAEDLVEEIKQARSAHDAQKVMQAHTDKLRPNWEEEQRDVMKSILRCKIEQHPYVLKKLLQSGDREIIEDSWRDDVWGWGEKKEGENRLGKIWMELREEYKERI